MKRVKTKKKGGKTASTKRDQRRLEAQSASSQKAARRLDEQQAAAAVGFGGGLAAFRRQPAGVEFAEQTIPTDGVNDADFEMNVRLLSKRDATTRGRALDKLGELFAERSSQQLESLLPVWTKYATRAALDNSKSNRIKLHRTMQVLVVRAEKLLGKHVSFEMMQSVRVTGFKLNPQIRGLFGPWWILRHDPHAEVSSAARESYMSAFPSEDKQLRAVAFCTDAFVSFLEKQFELRTMSDMGSTSAEEAKDRFDRVIYSCVMGYSEIVSLPTSTYSGEQLDKLNNLLPTVLGRISSDSNLVRRSVYYVLRSIHRGSVLDSSLDDTKLFKRISLIVLGMLRDDDTSCQKYIWETMIIFTQQNSSCWLSIYGDGNMSTDNEKDLIVRGLFEVLARGGRVGSQPLMYQSLVLLLGTIPADALIGLDASALRLGALSTDEIDWKSIVLPLGFAASLVNTIWAGLYSPGFPRAERDGGPAASLIHSYLECLVVLIANFTQDDLFREAVSLLYFGRLSEMFMRYQEASELLSEKREYSNLQANARARVQVMLAKVPRISFPLFAHRFRLVVHHGKVSNQAWLWKQLTDSCNNALKQACLHNDIASVFVSFLQSLCDDKQEDAQRLTRSIALKALERDNVDSVVLSTKLVAAVGINGLFEKLEKLTTAVSDVTIRLLASSPNSLAELAELFDVLRHLFAEQTTEKLIPILDAIISFVTGDRMEASHAILLAKFARALEPLPRRNIVAPVYLNRFCEAVMACFLSTSSSDLVLSFGEVLCIIWRVPLVSPDFAVSLLSRIKIAFPDLLTRSVSRMCVSDSLADPNSMIGITHTFVFFTSLEPRVRSQTEFDIAFSKDQSRGLRIELLYCLYYLCYLPAYALIARQERDPLNEDDFVLADCVEPLARLCEKTWNELEDLKDMEELFQQISDELHFSLGLDGIQLCRDSWIWAQQVFRLYSACHAAGPLSRCVATHEARVNIILQRNISTLEHMKLCLVDFLDVWRSSDAVCADRMLIHHLIIDAMASCYSLAWCTDTDSTHARNSLSSWIMRTGDASGKHQHYTVSQCVELCQLALQIAGEYGSSFVETAADLVVLVARNHNEDAVWRFFEDALGTTSDHRILAALVKALVKDCPHPERSLEELIASMTEQVVSRDFSKRGIIAAIECVASCAEAVVDRSNTLLKVCEPSTAKEAMASLLAEDAHYESLLLLGARARLAKSLIILHGASTYSDKTIESIYQFIVYSCGIIQSFDADTALNVPLEELVFVEQLVALLQTVLQVTLADPGIYPSRGPALTTSLWLLSSPVVARFANASRFNPTLASLSQVLVVVPMDEFDTHQHDELRRFVFPYISSESAALAYLGYKLSARSIALTVTTSTVSNEEIDEKVSSEEMGPLDSLAESLFPRALLDGLASRPDILTLDAESIRAFLLWWCVLLDALDCLPFERALLAVNYLRQHHEQLVDALLNEALEHISVANTSTIDWGGVTKLEEDHLSIQRPYRRSKPSGFMKRLAAFIESDIGLNEAMLFMPALAAHTMIHCMHTLPVLSRAWFNGLDKATAKHMSGIASQYVSPGLMRDEFDALTIAQTKSDFRIVTRLDVRELIVIYSNGEIKLKLLIELPDNYPLVVPKMSFIESSGVQESISRRWLVLMQSTLASRNGSLPDAIRVWHKNIEQHFAGVEECPICYSIVHAATNAVPRLSCRVCNHKFHAACIFKWFKSSTSNNCPLCRSVF